MSFNQFSPELLIEVLSHLLDVDSKIRLERVSKRFRDCIRNVESWKFNTELIMAEFESVEKLRSFLSHSKVVNALALNWSGVSAKYLATLLMFSDKLKITEFSYFVNLGDLAPANCTKCTHAVAACLGKFTNTLELANFNCCGNNKCLTLETICYMLPSCHNLRQIALGYIRDDEDTPDVVDPDQAQGNTLFLLDSLLNMPLETMLGNFFSTISGERLAAVCSTATEHSVSTIAVVRLRDFPLNMRFQMAQFCQALEPGAARAIKNLELEYIDCDWIELLPTFPVVFPNLTSLKIKHSPASPTVGDTMNIAQAIGNFLHASAQHEKALSLEITLTCEQQEEQDQSFGQLLWNSVNLIDAWRSGTKHTNDVQHWKRTLNHGNVTVSVELE